MKNQWFGNNKDVFMFDIVERVLKKGIVKSFLYVPMLTAGKASDVKPDRKQARAGYKNKPLVKFLDGCIAEGKRDVRQLFEYFPQIGITDTLFTVAGRQKYFDAVVKEIQADTLILVDPDKGLLPPGVKPNTHHVLENELKATYEKMDEKSLLMVYSDIVGDNSSELLHEACHAFLERIAGKDPICMFDTSSAFFLVTKTQKLERKLLTLAGEYAELYG